MEDAARAWTEVASEQSAAVCICLKRGNAAQSAYILEDVPGGTTISIGAGAECDWQLHAAGVPAHAVSVLMLSGNLFVRSTCQGDVLVDGRPLGDAWMVVPDGADIDIGLAQLEVTRRRGLDSGQHPLPLPLELPLPATRPERGPVMSMATQAEFGVSAPVTLRPVAWYDAAGPAAAVAQQSEPERPSRLGLFAPSLLGEDEPDRASSWWLYLIAVLATLSAYATWVVALDEF